MRMPNRRHVANDPSSPRVWPFSWSMIFSMRTHTRRHVANACRMGDQEQESSPEVGVSIRRLGGAHFRIGCCQGVPRDVTCGASGPASAEESTCPGPHCGGHVLRWGVGARRPQLRVGCHDLFARVVHDPSLAVPHHSGTGPPLSKSSLQDSPFRSTRELTRSPISTEYLFLHGVLHGIADRKPRRGL